MMDTYYRCSFCNRELDHRRWQCWEPISDVYAPFRNVYKSYGESWIVGCHREDCNPNDFAKWAEKWAEN